MEPLRGEETSPEPRALVSRTIELETCPPPRSVLDAADAPRTLWAAPDEPTVVGSGEVATLVADGADRFDTIRTNAERLFADGDVQTPASVARPRLVGGFAFHHDHLDADPWEGFPTARFVLPNVQVTYADESAWLTVTGLDADPAALRRRLSAVRNDLIDTPTPEPSRAPPGVRSRHRTTSIETWRRSVSTAIERIEDGELRKVVLAQALEARLNRPLDVVDAILRLGESHPDCVRFLIEPEHGLAAFLGSTPERLVALRDRTLKTDALAGSVGRGDTPAEDERLTRQLLEDDKNLHEHELVVEAIREQLLPYASSVRTGERDVRRLATIQHIETPVAATLEWDEHVLSLVEALHPTPAVGGLPPDEALSTIRETESFRRGWYAAPVGWFDADGNGSFAVAIRSALVHEDVATLFAGVGIVGDSDPDREWEEVQLKYRSILDELE